jgi:hypothetical protein
VFWAIQTNIIYEPDKIKILAALENLGFDYRTFSAIPFSDELPPIEEKNVLFYGSTNVINSIYKSQKWNPGTFFTESFDFRVWCDKYKILSSNFKLLKLRDIEACHFYGEEKHAFIRPVLDLKEFAGDVVEWDKFEAWKNNLLNLELLLDCVCVVAEPFAISKEWRTFIVDGKVVSASQYREYLRLSPVQGAPREVVAFAEAQASVYSPHSVFVMDIGKSGDEFYVIEVGCFNSAGFYESNIETIFQAVQDHVLSSSR